MNFLPILKRNLQNYLKVLSNLIENPFLYSLGTHRVNTPKWGRVYSSRVTKDIRIIWDFKDKKLIILVLDIGGHEGSKSVY
jgi:mRNA-degrading endonuclease YafQ of YafQ-DinJ toxin-antitoxin module